MLLALPFSAHWHQKYIFQINYLAIYLGHPFEPISEEKLHEVIRRIATIEL